MAVAARQHQPDAAYPPSTSEMHALRRQYMVVEASKEASSFSLSEYQFSSYSNCYFAAFVMQRRTSDVCTGVRGRSSGQSAGQTVSVARKILVGFVYTVCCSMWSPADRPAPPPPLWERQSWKLRPPEYRILYTRRR